MPSNGTLTGIDRTGAQTPPRRMYGIAGLPWETAPRPGTYEEYRRMRGQPTIAMARAAATAPIKAAAWSYEESDGAPDGALELVQEVMDGLRGTILVDGSRALDYGWQPFEIVWRERGDGFVVIDRLKPLLPDITEVLIDKTTGVFCGLKQGKVVVPRSSCWVHTHDSEAGDLFGRSRHENIREFAWTPWVHLSKRLQAYTTKVAGIIMQLHYPPGTSADQSGADRENDVLAERILSRVAEAGSVAIPTIVEPWALDLLQKGANINDLIAWRFSFLEAGTPHQAQMVEAMRYHDSLMMRGWLVPERVALEGQRGTLAESSAHADIALSVAQETLDERLASVNGDLVDPMLAVNFGRAARGSVRVTAAPLSSESRAWLRDLLKQVLANPGNIDLLATWLDIDAGLDQIGAPKATDVVEMVEEPDEVTPAVTREVTGDPAMKDVQGAALNGAQIASMVELAKELADKQLPPEAVRQMMLVAFPLIDKAAVDKIIRALTGFTPAPPQTEAPEVVAALYRGVNRGRR